MSKNKIKSFAAKIAVTVFVLLYANVSMATVYECNTEQVWQWKHGKLVPDSSRASGNHSVLRFDDEKGVLWEAFDKFSDFLPSHLDVVQKMETNSYGGLTAVLKQVVNGAYVSTNVFRLSIQDKTEGIVFLEYTSIENRIATGKCHIGK